MNADTFVLDAELNKLALEALDNEVTQSSPGEHAIAPSISNKPYDNLESDVLRHAHENDGIISDYLNHGETVVGYGYGGSESMTLFVKKESGAIIVRKVLSEFLLTTKWHRDGTDVMLHPCVKAKRQTRYLMNLPNAVKSLLPEVLDVLERQKVVAEHGNKSYYELSYDMSYIPGIELSKFIREYKPSPKVVAILYAEIFRYLRVTLHGQRRRIPKGPTLEQSYFSKIERRLGLCKETSPITFSDALLEADEIILNGKRLRNVKTLLRCFRGNPAYNRVLEPRFHSLVVGDTNTENIKIGNIEPLLKNHEDASFHNPPFTAEELEVKFLDPRAIGFHEEGIDTGLDDPMYDNKPWHNSLGNYDKIHGEHFDLTFELHEGVPKIDINFHDEHPYVQSYDGIDEYFADAITAAWDLHNPESDVLKNDPYWLFRFVFVMGTHFMAMPPYHFGKTKEGELLDSVDHQKRPLAVYAEGIKWLNLALDMLEGKIDNVWGIPVPRLNVGDAMSSNAFRAGKATFVA
ncbi:hypothetical protein [Sulfuriflexus mobilis]|uniref:hypothetical protein n=1 Tax=Sulfuriflexus mobilis TaxID=1811807 RepID=UPI000F817F5A|nr:hypothetical protein [Sulfuriflexus mobilis]